MSERDKIADHERRVLNAVAENLRAESRELYNSYGCHDASLAVGEAACLIEKWCVGDENLIGWPCDATDDIK